MTQRRKDHLSQQAFEDLHARVAKVKAGTVSVSLPVEAMKALLKDHAELQHRIASLEK